MRLAWGQTRQHGQEKYKGCDQAKKGEKEKTKMKWRLLGIFTIAAVVMVALAWKNLFVRNNVCNSPENIMRQNAAKMATKGFKLPLSVDPEVLVNGVYSIDDDVFKYLQHFVGRTNQPLWSDAQQRAKMMLDREGCGSTAITPELINQRALRLMMENAMDRELPMNTRAAYAQALKGAEWSYMMYTGGGNNEARVKEVASWKAPRPGTWQGVPGNVGRRTAWTFDENGNLSRNSEPTNTRTQRISDIKGTWHHRQSP